MSSEPLFILETSRLILRRQILADLDALWALYCNPEITRHIPDAPRSYQAAKQELEWHQHGHPRHPELGLWAAIYKPTGQFIGRCGLLPWTIDGQFEVEVAYTLAQNFWGQGLATEAAQGIRDYAFNHLHLTRLVCLIEPGNLASQRVAEKTGLTFEKEVIEAGSPPFFIYSMLKPH